MQKAVIVAWGHANRVRTGIRGLGMVPPLVVLVAAFQFLSGGRFLTLGNIGVLLNQAAVNMVLGAGMTFVVLAGGIDLSVSSILAAAVVAGLTASNIAGLAVFWPLASLGVGSACRVLNGLLVYDRLVQLQPSPAHRRIRGVVRFYAGDGRGALDDLLASSEAEPDDLYGQLWLDIVRQRQHVDVPLIRQNTAGDGARWPTPALSIFSDAFEPAAPQ